ncbi:MAG: exodeoxyribonuclease VII small subunit [Holosporaceae bacterium]|nr:MAG: exodeoxyribonuclease VII small subunit [Holosporaceae bacterium]
MKDPESLSFEQAVAELESIVRKLEAGQDTLEISITLYERGVALKKRCENELKEAQMKVEKISLDVMGNPVGIPLLSNNFFYLKQFIRYLLLYLFFFFSHLITT